jgi:hypothetical protein
VHDFSGEVQKFSGEVQNDLRRGAHLPSKSGHAIMTPAGLVKCIKIAPKFLSMPFPSASKYMNIKTPPELSDSDFQLPHVICR